MNQKTFALLLALYVVLGCWKGHVAIFRPGQTEPWQIFPKKAEALPQSQQDALAEGIVVRNERDLQNLLADYLS